ncbi:MAG: hypothetical protein PHU25_12965 [Deltaproteobacteria bacterium]|nr:hypothetical protein [Deltaproteobacteria bacterium]
MGRGDAARILVLVSILEAACAKLPSPQESYGGPVNSCGADGDCAEGSCDTSMGVCTVAGAGGRSYIVKVIPDPAQSVPSQVFEVVLDAAGKADAPLVVNRPLTVIGRALAGGSEGEALNARVIFTESGLVLPGRPPRITVYEAEGRSRDYRVDLLPGLYRITVIPGGTQASRYPVFYLDDVEVAPTHRRVDLVLPAFEGLVAVEGRVRRGGWPVDGLTIEAIDGQTSRVVSTASVTGCEGGSQNGPCGSFSMRLAPDVSAFSLRISRPDEPSYPTTVVSGFEVEPGASAVDLTDDAALSLAALGAPLRYRARVEKPVELSSGGTSFDPAPSCLVVFESDDVARGKVTRSVTTNESGDLETVSGVLGIDLYPAEYRVTVIPPEAPSGATADYAILSYPDPITISGSSPIGGQVFSLPLRPVLAGSVTAGGSPMPLSTLAAEPHGSADAPMRSSTSTTADDGTYFLPVDMGLYSMVAEAPPQSGFAWGRTLTTVTGSGELDVALPIPFVARARLHSEAVDVGGAVVEWYEERDGAAYAVARVTADGSGNVTALLPP